MVSRIAAAQAAGLPYPPLRARLLLLLANAQVKVDEVPRARASVEQAVRAAAEGCDNLLVARAWMFLTALTRESGDLDAAVSDGFAAEMAVARAGRPPSLVGDLAYTLGELAEARGRFDEAEMRFQERIATAAEDPQRLYPALMGMAGLPDELGRLPDSEALYRLMATGLWERGERALGLGYARRAHVEGSEEDRKEVAAWCAQHGERPPR